MFKKIDLSEGYLDISQEVIDPQLDDKSIAKLIDLFGEVLSEYRTGGYINSSFRKSDSGSKLITKIEDLVSERFGFKISLLLVDNYGNSTVHNAPPPVFNVLFGDLGEYFEDLKGFFSNNPGADRKYVSLNATMNNMATLNKALNTKGVTIDNKRAVIKGIPDDYRISIIMDIYMYFKYVNITPEELTSIFMHEIGHLYTGIEQSYRAVKNVTVFADAMSAAVNKHGKTGTEALVYAYKETFNKELKAGSKTVIIDCISEFHKESTGFTLSNHHTTDCEQLADQFMSRFGLGDAFATYEQKYYKDVLSKYKDVANNEYNSSLASIYIFIFTMFIAFILAIPLLGLILMQLAILATISFLGSVTDWVTESDAGPSKSYDDYKRRVERIRNDIVRQVRLYNLPKEMVVTLLKQYDVIMAVINSLPDKELNKFEKLHLYLNSKARISYDAKRIEQLMEDAMENSLHMTAFKIKNMGA